MSKKDPLTNLIDYVNTVKPYHTKIYEVLMQYGHNEPVRARVKESYQITTTMTTPEANKWLICDGVGWDATPYSLGLWDYPYECNSANPSKVFATVSESLKLEMTMYPVPDQAFGYVQDHVGNIGWDMTRWDWTQWDSINTEPWVEISTTPVVQTPSATPTDEPIGATITESLSIQVI